ncbi:hypothetical protein GCM10007036_16700 [Alsobacter metallidurans]|uniref:Uncharacterized protein n=1 Tax=Alsobacter metallidurans TaxID=340221 RepID=A0A917MH84_9HYPH|nr:hypothetical protein GCM10007036_16700 [Alsobacter metallidurans]
MEECRSAAVRAITRAPIGSEGAIACRELLTVLDNLAGALTGDHRRFWSKPHYTPEGGGGRPVGD